MFSEKFLRRLSIHMQQAGAAVGTVVPITSPAATPEQLKELETVKAENVRLQKQAESGSAKLKELEGIILSPEYMEFITKKGKGGGEEDGGRRRSEEAADPEEMTNTQLVNFIIKNVAAKVEEIVKPVSERTGKVDTQQQITAAVEQYPDFWDYREAMLALSKAKPSMGPEELYLQVRGIESATGKTLKKPKEEMKEALESAGGKKPVSGESSTGPGLGQGDHKVKPAASYLEAGEKHYDKIFGK